MKHSYYIGIICFLITLLIIVVGIHFSCLNKFETHYPELDKLNNLKEQLKEQKATSAAKIKSYKLKEKNLLIALDSLPLQKTIIKTNYVTKIADIKFINPTGICNEFTLLFAKNNIE